MKRYLCGLLFGWVMAFPVNAITHRALVFGLGKQEILNILGTRSRECLRNIEDGLIIYRKVKDEYEVQLTLRLNTDMLYE